MNKITNRIYTVLIYLFLYVPILIVIVFSFNSSKHSLLWKGFTLNWYHELFHDGSLLIVAIHSLVLGLLAATGATLIGSIAAVSLYRYQFFGKKLLHGLIFVLIVCPEIVLGISLMLFYSALNITLGFWTLLLGHITLCVPFVTVTVYSRVITLDASIFEAAMDLGADDRTIFTKIIIPLLLPAIIAGALLSFTLSFDDVIISYFISGPGFDILPLRIYSMVKLGIKPEINALCTLLLGFTLLVVVYAQAILRKKQ